jgi:2-polyprenyl-6-methoxyphenol hydroxylase-like FAD-dependent oxidoreductase
VSGDAVDALVVGAGPVGLTMAAELARHGMRCRIIDRNAARSDKSKALVLWPRSLELLASSGAVEPFVATGIHAVRARIMGGAAPLVQLTFDGMPSPYAFALMIPQSETERLLEAHLAAFGVAVERCVELLDFEAAPDAVTVRLRRGDASEETLRVAWLLGCDGPHSTVRHGLGMEFAGSAEPNDWILADVHIDGAIAADEMRIHVSPAGIAAFFPIGPGRFRVIADRGPAAGAQHPPDPTADEVQAVVTARGPSGLVVRDPVWLTCFRINERMVKEYRRGRVFLAGDAAHIHSPAGGQGMNTGMQDAYNLTWKLALVHAGRAPERLLDTYSRERSGIAAMVLRNAAAMTRLGTMRDPRARRLRNTIAPMLTSLGVVRAAIRDTLAEMNINYRGGPLSRDARRLGARLRARWARGVVAGDRAPDAAVVDATTGTTTQLFALLRSGRHCLLLCVHGSITAALQRSLIDTAAAVQRAHPDLVHVFVVAPSGTAGSLPLLLDRTGAVQAAYALHEPTAVLIRPDGYVGYLGQLLDGAGLLAHLASYLVASSD